MNNKKINYNSLCNEILLDLKNSTIKPKLLLHVCCAPCSSAVILKLKDSFQITVFYYNPNIAPFAEYKKRQGELQKLLSFYKRDFNLSCDILPCEYEHLDFLKVIKGLEKDREGGKRCEKCHALRLEKTASQATNLGFDYFCSTLSISPLKNASLINELGYSLQNNCLWLPNDFKKENGYLKSTQISKEYELYRQTRCGCEFSAL